MPGAAVEVTRAQVLAFRRRASGLGERLPAGSESLRVAAWAGLQDSAPRAALLSIHARVAGSGPDSWEDPSLVQLWGPRFNAYVVAERDRAVFSLGRLTDDPAGQRDAERLADRLEAFLDGRRLDYRDAGRALEMHPNGLRYAAPTGRVLMRWDGARRPTIWMVPPPDGDARDARLELARRYLHVVGPATVEAFAAWAGVPRRHAHGTFDALAGELTGVRTPVGDSWILRDDEHSLRAPADASTGSFRLLPSGDAYLLLQGSDRGLLVDDLERRSELWPSRVWPGAVLVDGEVAATWRRSGATVTIGPWRRVPAATRRAIETEVLALPLPDLEGRRRIRWDP